MILRCLSDVDSSTYTTNLRYAVSSVERRGLGTITLASWDNTLRGRMVARDTIVSNKDPSYTNMNGIVLCETRFVQPSQASSFLCVQSQLLHTGLDPGTGPCKRLFTMIVK